MRFFSLLRILKQTNSASAGDVKNDANTERLELDDSDVDLFQDLLSSDDDDDIDLAEVPMPIKPKTKKNSNSEWRLKNQTISSYIWLM